MAASLENAQRSIQGIHTQINRCGAVRGENLGNNAFLSIDRDILTTMETLFAEVRMLKDRVRQLENENTPI